MYIPFSGLLHKTRKPSDASHQTASRKMITGCQRSSRPAGLFTIERYERLILLLLAAGLLGLSDLLCIVDNLLK